MTEKELIGKIRELRQIRPRKDWVLLAKSQILGEEKMDLSLLSFFRPIIRVLFSFRPVLVGGATLLVFFGLFGFAQNSLPGDFLYPIKKLTEKSQAIFVSENERPIFQLEQVDKRLEDLNNIIETNQVKSLVSGLEELKSAKAEAEREVLNLKNKPQKEAVKAAKKIAPKLVEINKKEEQVLAQLFIETEKTDEPTEKTIAEFLIKDLESRTLTDKQQTLLEETKEDFGAGNYDEALLKIWNLSQ